MSAQEIVSSNLIICSDFLLSKKHDQISEFNFQFTSQVLISITSTSVTSVFSSAESRSLIYNFAYAKALELINTHVIKILINENISKKAYVKNVSDNSFSADQSQLQIQQT